MAAMKLLNPSRILERHFFQATAAQSLSLFRFLYCSILLWKVLGTAESQTGKFGAVAWHPIPLFEMLGIPLMSAEAAMMWERVLIASLALTALGVLTRLSATAAWISYFVFMGTMLGFTKAPDSNYVFHSKNIVIFVLMILSVSPGVGRWGFDGWRRRRWRWRVTDPSQQLLSAWPNQLIKLTLGLAYFGAGYCKVVTSPLWADGYTLQAYLIAKFLLLDVEPGIWLANHYWLCLLLSVGTLFLELTFIAVVFFPRLTWFYVAGGLSFHYLIHLTMRISFFPYFGYIYLIFVDWPTLRRLWGFVTRAWQPIGKLLGLSSGRATVVSNASFATRTQTLGDTWPARAVVLGMGGMLLFCVVARVESWPFTDYRVFESRANIEGLCVYRLAARTPDGRLELLPRWSHPASPVVINRRFRKYQAAGDLRSTEALLTQTADRLLTRSPGQYEAIVLLERRAEKSPGGSGVNVLDNEITQVPVVGVAAQPLPARVADAKPDSQVQ